MHPPPDRSPQLLTPAEAAEQLRIGKTMLFKLMRNGEIKGIKIGKATRITQASLDAWIAKLEQAE